MTHYFRIKHAVAWQALAGLPQHPRFNEPCEVLARGRNGNLLVRFADGYLMVTVRWGVRKLRS